MSTEETIQIKEAGFLVRALGGDLTDAQNEYVNKMVLTGILAGVGTGSLSALLRERKHVADRSKMVKSEDDDTLYVVKKSSEDEETTGALTTTAATLGAIGTAAATHMLITKLHKNMRLRDAQKQLDEAQKYFVDAHGYKELDTPKKASDDTIKPSNPQTITAGALTFLSMMALASGVASYKALEGAFPRKKIPRSFKPKRIEVVTEDELSRKTANCSYSSMEDATSLVASLLWHTKEASAPDTRTAIAAFATGRGGEFSKVASDIGYHAALDAMKGVSLDGVTDLDVQMAILDIHKTAGVADEFDLTAGAEYSDNFPNGYGKVASLTEDEREDMFNLAAIAGRQLRSDIISSYSIAEVEKYASLVDAIQVARAGMHITKDDKEEDEGKKEQEAADIVASPDDTTLVNELKQVDVIDKLLGGDDTKP